MTSLLAQQLDELMGKDRDAPSDQKRETKFDDEDVCKPFLVAFCPHEMFVNTKADLGPCTKLHDDKYRQQYCDSSRFMKLGYEEDFLSWLTRMKNDMDRKIKKHKERLELTQPDSLDDSVPMDPARARMEHKMKELEEKINEYVAKAEMLGADGEVTESQEASRVAERYRMEREQHRMAMHNIPFGADEVKPMEVCEICGCFLIVGDAQQRIDEHMLGKQHIGYAKIRETVKLLLKKMDEKRKILAEEYEQKRKVREEEKGKSVERNDKEGGIKKEPRDNKDKEPREKEKERDKDRERDRSSRDSRDKYSSTSSSRHNHSSPRRDSRDHRERDRRDRDRNRDSRSSRDHRERSHKRSRSRDRDRKRDEKRDDRRSSRKRSTSKDKDRLRREEEREKEVKKGSENGEAKVEALKESTDVEPASDDKPKTEGSEPQCDSPGKEKPTED